ncbi:MAG TPA: serine/threonine protein kinase, partial [Planctomycetes bacterium]|nr:serine/threonine protein kinase [Planctomycetota bacterium]
HRDLKPANVLFTASGRPLLVDFGVAQLLDVETLTRTHMLVGTPAYMAPEQVRALREEIGPRTDVYALGAIL